MAVSRPARLFELFERFDLNDPDAGAANCMVIAIAVKLLDDDLRLHTGEVGKATDLGNVVTGKAGARANADRTRGSCGDHGRFAVGKASQTLTHFFLQLGQDNVLP